jgi:hypothetical protein
MADLDAHDESRSRSTALLTTALVVALGLAALFAFLWQNSKDIDPAELTTELNTEASAVENRAEEVIDVLLNYDSGNFEERADEMRALATGDFRDQYEELIEEGIRELLEESTASSSGEILDGPSVAFTSATESIVLARVQQTTQSNDDPGGRQFFYVFRIDFIKTGEQWKADQLEIIASSN